MPEPANTRISADTVIILPVFNDGESLRLLSEHLFGLVSALKDHSFSLLVIDDGSTEEIARDPWQFPTYFLRLHRNIGHQKALAIGLAYLNEHFTCNRVVVMDADGEDRPEDVLSLMDASAKAHDQIVFAGRAKRQEGFFFRLFYMIYKICFRLFTGRKIGFGNFSVIPFPLLTRLVHYSEIWSNLPGGIIKSRLPYTSVPTLRGKRLAGYSKMNFTSLLLHGLGAIAVFMDVIAARLLILSVGMILFSVLAIVSILAIRSFTDWAIPGWASTLMSSMFIILLQSFLLSLFTLFLYLSSQLQRKFIPALHYSDYVLRLEKLN